MQGNSGPEVAAGPMKPRSGRLLIPSAGPFVPA
jgi:hypothetical protein